MSALHSNCPNSEKPISLLLVHSGTVVGPTCPEDGQSGAAGVRRDCLTTVWLWLIEPQNKGWRTHAHELPLPSTIHLWILTPLSPPKFCGIYCSCGLKWLRWSSLWGEHRGVHGLQGSLKICCALAGFTACKADVSTWSTVSFSVTICHREVLVDVGYVFVCGLFYQMYMRVSRSLSIGDCESGI